MIFTAFSNGRFDLGGETTRCALGRGGVIVADRKREGDGASPLGVWPIRKLFYRPDKGPRPATRIPASALTPHDGWCDDPRDGAYNRLVSHPYPASAEHLWRDDDVYDLVVILGHNDDPVVAGAGSAIFLHVARPEFSPTDGCVALAKADLDELLRRATPGDAVAICEIDPEG